MAPRPFMAMQTAGGINRVADCYARKIPKPSVIPSNMATSYTTTFRNKVLVLTLPPVSKRTSEKLKYLSLSKS